MSKTKIARVSREYIYDRSEEHRSFIDCEETGKNCVITKISSGRVVVGVDSAKNPSIVYIFKYVEEPYMRDGQKITGGGYYKLFKEINL